MIVCWHLLIWVLVSTGAPRFGRARESTCLFKEDHVPTCILVAKGKWEAPSRRLTESCHHRPRLFSHHTYFVVHLFSFRPSLFTRPNIALFTLTPSILQLHPVLLFLIPKRLHLINTHTRRRHRLPRLPFSYTRRMFAFYASILHLTITH